MREVRVPDIGDFKDVPIIAVLVKVGDRIEQEQPIVTLESDKATVDVPSPAAGKVAGSAGEGRRQGLRRQRAAPPRGELEEPREKSALPPRAARASSPEQPRPPAARSRASDRAGTRPIAGRADSTATCWCSAPAPAATPPPSAPRISANGSSWSSATRRSAGCA